MLNKLSILRAQGVSEEGFTLVELIIVVVIIGILSAVAIPIFMNQQKSAVAAGVKADVRSTNTNIAVSLTKDPTSRIVGGDNAVRVTKDAPWFYVGSGEDVEPVTEGAATASDDANTRAIISDTNTVIDIYGYWNDYVIEAHNTNLTGADHNYFVFTSETGKYVGTGDLG